MRGEIKEICTIDIGQDYRQNAYTFYQSGVIKHLYDESILSYNKEEWTTSQTISNSIKSKLIKECPNKYKKRLREVLDFNSRMN
ncbi:hypothetical protein U6A24_10095 [Aquimarina gracilis]|uniref:Uncharacterized protein n=1 Tax=Aquimarina gracilis TaxID=874422 RepID=A0ABU5ZUY5_9FLAO|nr:hypothetical protein [Aquimarina gracilis]MEB3345814.1 hypothetical protein [Aquimarina gracilis]